MAAQVRKDNQKDFKDGRSYENSFSFVKNIKLDGFGCLLSSIVADKKLHMLFRNEWKKKKNCFKEKSVKTNMTWSYGWGKKTKQKQINDIGKDLEM